MRQSTAGAATALVLVFAAGVAAGVALDRTWLAPEEATAGASRAEADGDDGKRKEGREDRERTVIERFSEELELTRSQRTRIDTILAHFRDRMHEMWSEVRPRYESMVDSARTRIIEVLDEEQARRYRELLEREREKHDGRWGDEDPDSAGTGHGAAEDRR